MGPLRVPGFGSRSTEKDQLLPKKSNTNIQGEDVEDEVNNNQAKGRLNSIDLLRGLIMIIMSWDHVKDFVAIYKGSDNTAATGPWRGNHSESWQGEMETYSFNYGYFLARIVSHYCAPGFALLMGVSMVLLSKSRRSKLGWGSLKLIRFFVLRGLLLIALGFVVRGAELILLIDPNPRVDQMFSLNTTTEQLVEPKAVEIALTGFFQVMTALGIQMIVLSFVLPALHYIENRFAGLREWKIGPLRTFFGFPEWLRFGFSQSVLFCLGCCCFLATHLVIHHLVFDNCSLSTVDCINQATWPIKYNGDTSNDATSFAQILFRFLIPPGSFVNTYTLQMYPVIPWLGISLWGCAMATEFRDSPKAAHVRALFNGGLCLISFIVIRFAGGSVLNMRGYPLGEHTDHFFFSFFFVCKYPPELSYVCLTLGVDLIMLYCLNRVDTNEIWARIVLVYGTSPLAFYVSHFWLISLASLMVCVITGPGATCTPGVPLGYCVFVWLGILIIEQGICHAFGSFKAKKDPDSLWRLL